MKRMISLLSAVLAFMLSCAPAHQQMKSNPVAADTVQVGQKTATWTEINDRIKPDPDVQAVIQPYRDQLNAEMNTVIGTAEVDLVRGRPEGTLGNFVTDVMLETARKFGQVDCAITNSGGLRSPVFTGDITVGSIFQVMPFENRLVIARFTGEQFMHVIREIAEMGGAPVSGLTIISTDNIVEAYIGEEKVDENRSYTVATIDYLLKGGGSMEAMWKGKLVKDTGVLLREALIEYVRQHKTIDAKIEGRIVIQ